MASPVTLGSQLGASDSMVNGETLFQMIGQMISALIGMEVPSADLNLINEGMIDSLVLVQLVLGIEERFGVEVALDDLEFENFESVRSIAALVADKASVGASDMPIAAA